jgi:hypothetical protein
MTGDVMPHCLGVATSDDTSDLTRCTCPKAPERRRRLEKKIEGLTRRIVNLERAVYSDPAAGARVFATRPTEGGEE